jgi:hypothetical protein
MEKGKKELTAKGWNSKGNLIEGKNCRRQDREGKKGTNCQRQE